MKHDYKRLFLCISIAWISFIAPNCLAFEVDVFVIGSSAIVRKEPSEGSAAAGQIPIGTKGRFKGAPAQVVESPNKECTSADSKMNPKWSCVCFDALLVATGADYDKPWCGWISKELLVTKEPKLSDLISQLVKTAPENLQERKKWAERAISLAPSNQKVQKQWLDILENIGDTTAIEAAKRLFEVQQAPIPRSSEPKLILTFQRGQLEPIAEVKQGQLHFRGFNTATQFEFRNRGSLYHLYSQGNKVGAVETTARFDCGVQDCPIQVFARTLLKDSVGKLSNGIATNFELPQTNAISRQATKDERAILLKMAHSWLDQSKKPVKEKQAFRKFLKQNSGTVGLASWSNDHKVMLIGNWTMGSENDMKYGNYDSYFESLLIIAEQQTDSSYKRISGSGSIAEEGCSYFDHIDVNADGVDEILLLCERLEGNYYYRLLQRENGGWRIAKDRAKQ